MGRKRSRGSGANKNRRASRSASAAPRSKPKMSAVLLDIADPLLDGLTLPDHADAYRLCLMIAASIWNATRHQKESERMRSFEDAWNGLGRLKSEDLRQRMRDVYDRAVDRYPLQVEARAIAAVNTHFGSDGRYHVDVASVGRG